MKMKFALFRLVDGEAVKALVAREFRLALLNRYLHVFFGLALLGGVAAAVFSEDANATGFFHLQIGLYFVSLFALLAGIGSAQAEREEWQLLFTQPLPRSAFVLGKYLALLCLFAAVLILLFGPSFFSGTEFRIVGVLYLETILLAGTFLACGLAAGYLAHDRAQGLILGVSGWLVLLFGIDLLALFAARWSGIQSFPDLWVALLMLNPLDSFRIDALFSLEQIPAEAASKTPLANWWTGHAGAWFAGIAVIWATLMTTVAGWRMSNWEE